MIRDLIHGATDPYEDPSPAAQDERGWNSTDALFADLIGELRPGLIAEVGTWKGASALHMWRCCRARGIDAEIVCVDTWLGSIEHWERRGDPQYSLHMAGGYPRLYDIFRANVITAGAQSAITPFPATSAVAARFLAAREVRFDLVYVDAGHEYEDVAADIAAWLPLVRAGGVLFGDDVDWSGVRQAVWAMPGRYGAQADVVGNKWVVRV